VAVAAAEGSAPRRSLLARVRTSGRLGRWSLRATALLYLGLMVVLPLAAIVAKGFSNGMSALSSALSSFGAWEAIRLTLVASALCAVINGVMGTLLAYVLVRIPFRGRGALATLVDLPFAVPTLVAGVMLVALYGPTTPLGRWLADHGIHIVFAQLGVLLALLFVTLPLVVRTVQPVLLELDPAEEEAARVLGAGRWTTFRRVMLPALRPAIMAGAMLAFARALGEFGAVVIISGNIPGRTLTAPVYIFSLVSQFRYPEAAAVSTLLFAMAFVLVLITERLVAPKKDAEPQ
jgi:sulfate/thiosulfate transport system permease protein